MSDNYQPLIVVKDLHKSYEDQEVLKGISLYIEEGDLVSIIGPSGCGKSTFLRCLNCLELLDSGTITIGDISLQREHRHAHLGKDFYFKAHELRKEVGMAFQHFNLFPHKTIIENVMLAPMVVKGIPHEDAAKQATRLLDKVGLGSFLHRHPQNLSGGQQQRAAIARALAMAPRVMLYDEPTSSLDPSLVDEVLQVMRDLDADGMTQVIVTHEMRFAKEASDYIIYMENGEIIEISDEDEIFVSPKDDRTRHFLKRFMEAL